MTLEDVLRALILRSLFDEGTVADTRDSEEKGLPAAREDAVFNRAFKLTHTNMARY